MEILTEKQQIDNGVKSSWSVLCIQDNYLSLLKNKLSNYRDRLFKSDTTMRVMEFEIREQEDCVNHLRSYHESLCRLQEQNKINSMTTTA